MKWMKTARKPLLMLVIALIVSACSMMIQTRKDTATEDTIGVEKYWGFPLAFRVTAPGLSWARFSVEGFALNSAIWLAVIAGGQLILNATKRKKGSNQRMEAIGNPPGGFPQPHA